MCSPAPEPGTRKLIALLKRTYGQDQYMGTSRSCGNGGTSEHKDGRANAKAFLKWLIGPDSAGVPAGNATRLGVMYIGWNNKFWAAYSPERGWTQLDGCPKSNDTTCHRNHMHISLTWDGASGRSSMCDGTALAPFCSSARSDAVVLDAGRADAAVPFSPSAFWALAQASAWSPEVTTAGGAITVAGRASTTVSPIRP